MQVTDHGVNSNNSSPLRISLYSPSVDQGLLCGKGSATPWGVGASRQAVSKWELNDTTPDRGSLIQISKMFNVTIDWWLMGEGDLYRVANGIKLKKGYY